MKLFVLSLLLFCSISCKKESLVYDFSPFKNKYLVCDSMRVSNETSDKMIVLGRDKGYDAKFADTYTIYSNPVQTYGYADPANIRFSQYKDQQYAKIYFSALGTDFHLGDYLIIEAVSGKHITLLHNDIRTKEKIRYYYTAD